MAKTKYKCTNCGKIFDEPVAECDECGDEGQIKRVASVPSWSFVAAGIVAALILIILVWPSTEYKAELKPDRVTGDVTIEIAGLSKSKAKQYKVAVFRGTQMENIINITASGKVVYPSYQMLENECYTFMIVKAKGHDEAKEVKWSTQSTYCKPLPPPEDEAPMATYSIEWNRNTKPYSHTVTIHVSNRDKLGEIIYSIGDKSQRDSVFPGLAPGNYEAIVRSGSKSTTLPIILGQISEPRKPITKAEVQAVLDQVARGEISAGVAKDRISVGEVRLAAPVDGITSLWEVLHELEQGAVTGDNLQYIVVDFKVNQTTGLIQSGTLKLRAK